MKLFRIEARERDRSGNTQLICSLQSSKLLDNASFPESDDLNLNFQLEEKAKRTNFLSNSSIAALGFVIDDKVETLLGSMNLSEHRIYATPVIEKGETLSNYRWLHFKEDENAILSTVDWNNSTFVKTNLFLKEGNVKIGSAEEYQRLSAEDHMITYEPECLSFKDKQILNKDMFTLGSLFYGVIVSERLKESLEKEKITGIRFTDISEMFND